jgi:hypothetical protein
MDSLPAVVAVGKLNWTDEADNSWNIHPMS